ncbi:MAG: ATP-dependent helicase [Syntrophales bacterium]|nr:ATP-dependent helicase [Syntrophales bacterium]
MLDYRKELNEEQLAVVMEPGGPLLVLAGAGSGKTRTLTYRVARLLEVGVPPWRIILATFTNKAARAMLSRVAAIMPEQASQVWGGTFHHIGNRILRRHADLLGYDRNFTILDAEDAVSLIGSCLNDLISRKAHFPKKDVLQAIFSLAVNTGNTLEEVVLSRYPYLLRFLDDFIAVEKAYRERKVKLNTMDFDDLLFNWRRLLREFPHVGEYYSERFLHLFVDEYQDTNYLQGEITDLLAKKHRNLTVVGDDAQSIYAFRGANYENILTFPQRYPDARIFRLETNYRSTPEILHFANLSIKNNVRQFEKTLRSVRHSGSRPVLVALRNASDQACFVAEHIKKRIREGVPRHQIAVLYRAHYQALDVQLELNHRGIPYELRSGIRFFEQAHVKDITAYLKILANGRDELAWKRVLHMQPLIGRATAEKVWQEVGVASDPLETFFGEGMISKVSRASRPGLMACRNLLRLARDASPEELPAPMMEAILNGGYADYLKENYADAMARLEDIVQLINFADRFSSLTDFLAELALQTSKSEAGEDDAGEGEGKVVLSTIHQAKGLEWRMVFILWCTDGMLPLYRCLNEPGGEEEERRLFYVALTRAKDELYLCRPSVSYSRTSGCEPTLVSRFIKEVAARPGSPDCPYEHWYREGG